MRSVEERVFVGLVWFGTVGFAVIMDSMGFNKFAEFTLLICIITGAIILATELVYHLDRNFGIERPILPMTQQDIGDLQQIVVDPGVPYPTSTSPVIVHDYLTSEHEKHN